MSDLPSRTLQQTRDTSIYSPNWDADIFFLFALFSSLAYRLFKYSLSYIRDLSQWKNGVVTFGRIWKPIFQIQGLIVPLMYTYLPSCELSCLNKYIFICLCNVCSLYHCLYCICCMCEVFPCLFFLCWKRETCHSEQQKKTKRVRSVPPVPVPVNYRPHTLTSMIWSGFQDLNWFQSKPHHSSSDIITFSVQAGWTVQAYRSNTWQVELFKGQGGAISKGQRWDLLTIRISPTLSRDVKHPLMWVVVCDQGCIFIDCHHNRNLTLSVQN